VRGRVKENENETKKEKERECVCEREREGGETERNTERESERARERERARETHVEWHEYLARRNLVCPRDRCLASRVTRLGEFSPLGCFYFGTSIGNDKSSPKFSAYVLFPR
jgi:hypothetical protein